MLFKYRKKFMPKDKRNSSLLSSEQTIEDNHFDTANVAHESSGRIDTQILKRNIENKLKTYNK